MVIWACEYWKIVNHVPTSKTYSRFTNFIFNWCYSQVTLQSSSKEVKRTTPWAVICSLYNHICVEFWGIGVVTTHSHEFVMALVSCVYYFWVDLGGLWKTIGKTAMLYAYNGGKYGPTASRLRLEVTRVDVSGRWSRRWVFYTRTREVQWSTTPYKITLTYWNTMKVMTSFISPPTLLTLGKKWVF